MNGIPKISKSVDELTDSYLEKSATVEEAAKQLVKNQITKCGTSGFLSGLGGLITLPVTVPANVSSVLYVQLRMVAALAKMGGFDVRSDQVQTMVYLWLTGSAITDVFKQTGIKFGQKITAATLNKIPGKVLISINQKVGFRLLTKSGTTGVINFAKVVPVAGGVVVGAIDIATTKVIAKNAYNIFIKKQMDEIKEVFEEDDIIENE